MTQLQVAEPTKFSATVQAPMNITILPAVIITLSGSYQMTLGGGSVEVLYLKDNLAVGGTWNADYANCIFRLYRFS